METVKTVKIEFPQDLNILPEEPTIAAGELSEIWENDAMFEQMILEEEAKRASGIPEWAILLF